ERRGGRGRPDPGPVGQGTARPGLLADGRHRADQPAAARGVPRPAGHVRPVRPRRPVLRRAGGTAPGRPPLPAHAHGPDADGAGHVGGDHPAAGPVGGARADHPRAQRRRRPRRRGHADRRGPGGAGRGPAGPPGDRTGAAGRAPRRRSGAAGRPAAPAAGRAGPGSAGAAPRPARV
ncbi:MAG: Transcriptional regulator, MarR family, partial [uncultured Blastococcus sp.]